MSAEIDLISYFNNLDVVSYIVGCTNGAVFAWAFAQKTVVRYAIERVTHFENELNAKEEHYQNLMSETCDRYEREIEGIREGYTKRLDQMNDEIKRLNEKIDKLQESRLNLAIKKDQF